MCAVKLCMFWQIAFSGPLVQSIGYDLSDLPEGRPDWDLCISISSYHLTFMQTISNSGTFQQYVILITYFPTHGKINILTPKF